MSSDLATDILAAAAEAHRANEVRARLDDLLVDGRLIVTDAALERLKQHAAACGVAGAFGPSPVSIPQWALVQVQAIPDDGAPHDIGGGKVAIVSTLDHKTILVAPAELLDLPAPRSMRLADDCYPPLGWLPRGDGPAFA